jgi:hypothetical protein
MHDHIRIAPIALFCYNRLDTLKITISSLKKNYLSNESHLYIFSDGPKNEEDVLIIKDVRNYLKTIVGFKSITIIEEEFNKGLSHNIIDGINYIFNYYDTIIILEDDLQTSYNFLIFMNSALSFYNNNNKIFSISGYSPIINFNFMNDVYFTKRSSSWGWAIWKNKWKLINWDISDYVNFTKNRNNWINFNKMGSDMSSQLNHFFNNKINSWCTVFTFNQYILNLYTVFPIISKISNVGTSHKFATNTKFNLFRFKTNIDHSSKIKFNFTNTISLNNKILAQFKKDNSITIRIINKIFNFLFHLHK